MHTLCYLGGVWRPLVLDLGVKEAKFFVMFYVFNLKLDKTV